MIFAVCMNRITWELYS